MFVSDIILFIKMLEYTSMMQKSETWIAFINYLMLAVFFSLLLLIFLKYSHKITMGFAFIVPSSDEFLFIKGFVLLFVWFFFVLLLMNMLIIGSANRNTEKLEQEIKKQIESMIKFYHQCSLILLHKLNVRSIFLN